MTEKRIMLSFPMKGKTREEIEDIKQSMISWLLDKYDDNCIVIESIIEDHESKSELECFSESIFHMSKANTLCMGKNWENARSCRLEHEIARAYGLDVIYYDNKDDDKCCGTCKHFQIDGMFGLWCDKKYDWEKVCRNGENCISWEK